LKLRLLLGLACVASVSIAACGAFSSDDDNESPLPERDAAPDALDLDAAPGADASVTDAPVADATAEAGAGSISFDSFEQGTVCGQWTGAQATVQRDTSSASSGVASCRICATAPGASVVKTIAGRGAGTYTMTAQTSNVSAPRWYALTYAYDDAGTLTGVHTNGGLFGAGWTLAQNTTVSTGYVSSLNVHFFIEGDAGACHLIDDVDVTYEP
jgi:hypothetical protein